MNKNYSKSLNKRGIIAIVGLMGVGKTTIGVRLAEKLQCYFIDTDQEIEDHEQKTIAEIFQQKGEKYFREIERKIVKEIVSREEDIVLSLGGGAFIDDEVRKLLKEKSVTIWLHADIDTILLRVGNKTNRPLLQQKNRRLVLEDLVRKRYPIYAESDLKFDTGSESQESVLKKIIYNIENLPIRKNLRIKNIINLPLGKRSYDIVVGNEVLKNLAEFLCKKTYSKLIVITDKNVAEAHLATLQAVLDETKIETQKIVIAPGEQSKSFASLEKISEEILSQNLDRKSLIIAFGGGVVGDLAGFIASILLRGIDFVQIPTTLLSMVDSSVGGKTAINSKFGKNLIGSFYQPKLVICDLNFLKTLSMRELRSGYAEVVKYGFIYDKVFFEFLEKNYEKIFNEVVGFDEEVMATVITKSCEIKSAIVSQDEKESSSGLRALLNFGHTFGHIFETETSYSSELLHGEAVAIGMVMAARMSQKLGKISAADFLRIKSHIEKVGLVTDPKKIRKKWLEENLIAHLYKDKKVENKNLNFVLLEAIGKGYVQRAVELSNFQEILREFTIAN